MNKPQITRSKWSQTPKANRMGTIRNNPRILMFVAGQGTCLVEVEVVANP